MSGLYEWRHGSRNDGIFVIFHMRFHFCQNHIQKRQDGNWDVLPPHHSYCWYIFGACYRPCRWSSCDMFIDHRNKYDILEQPLNNERNRIRWISFPLQNEWIFVTLVILYLKNSVPRYNPRILRATCVSILWLWPSRARHRMDESKVGAVTAYPV